MASCFEDMCRCYDRMKTIYCEDGDRFLENAEEKRRKKRVEKLEFGPGTTCPDDVQQFLSELREKAPMVKQLKIPACPCPCTLPKAVKFTCKSNAVACAVDEAESEVKKDLDGLWALVGVAVVAGAIYGTWELIQCIRTRRRRLLPTAARGAAVTGESPIVDTPPSAPPPALLPPPVPPRHRRPSQQIAAIAEVHPQPPFRRSRLPLPIRRSTPDSTFMDHGPPHISIDSPPSIPPNIARRLFPDQFPDEDADATDETFVIE